jgi:hypothetical protein
MGQFFKDGTGQLSATRLVFILWSLGVLIVWLFESLTNNQIEKIDQSIVTTIGMLMAGKAVQSFSPGDNQNQPAQSAQAQQQPAKPVGT